jgi:capsid protein
LTYSVSGQLPIAKIEKFAEHEFRGRRWMWVDPMKDMKAAEVAVDRGWKTNTQVAGDLGTDFDDNMEQYSVEKKTKTDAGFIEASRPGAAAPVQTQGEA